MGGGEGGGEKQKLNVDELSNLSKIYDKGA